MYIPKEIIKVCYHFFAPIEINEKVIVNHIADLKGDKFIKIWDSIDIKGNNYISWDKDFKRLLIKFIEDYIETELDGIDIRQNHEYAHITKRVANELKDDYEAILGVHGDTYSHQYFHVTDYVNIFRKYMKEIATDCL